ncbi:hypothetical protein [Pseudonocardia sp. N23]|uniref:hypothetical protein n=1 Tax=Pseudonocardia sp. N23 TaxID=1987376 RepID=UPI000BFC1FCB|nr:hypothetical protein [Pseudonocardia sp. N23]GAY07413.1 hypothetical protein TOK_3321 [Pseudonocardia sp. N23]
MPALLVVTAGPAHADTSDALRVAAQLGPGHGPAAVLLRLVLLVALTLTAGAGVAAAVSRGAPPRRLSVLAWAAAAVVVVGAEVTHLTGASTMTGTIVAAMCALAVPVLLTSRWVGAPTVATTLLLAVGLGSVHTGGAFVLDVIYAVGAAALVGLSILGVLTGPSTRPAISVRPPRVDGDDDHDDTADENDDQDDDNDDGVPRDRASEPVSRRAPARRAGMRATERPVAVGVRRGSAVPATDGGTTATGSARAARDRSRDAALRRPGARADARVDGPAGAASRGRVATNATGARPEEKPLHRNGADRHRSTVTNRVGTRESARTGTGPAARAATPGTARTGSREATRSVARPGSAAADRAPARAADRATARADLDAASRRRATGSRAGRGTAAGGPDATGTRRADRAPQVRLPVRRIAIAAGSVTTAAGLLQLFVSGPATLDDLLATPYGLVASAGVLLPAVATVLWALTGSRAGRARIVELKRFAAVAVGAGLAAVATLAALPVPAPGAAPGEPLLRAVDLGGTQLAVLVAPMRPGPNLVQVSGSGYPAPGSTVATPAAPAGHHGGAPAGPAGLTVDAGTGPVTVTTRDGATGGWAVVDIPAGTERLTLRSGPVDAAVPVDVGTGVGAPTALGGADGPECASALLGTFVARTAAGAESPMPSCPSDVLADGDAVSLRAMTNFVGEHGVAAIRLMSDDSPRSVAAAAVVRDEAARHDVPLVDAPGSDVALVVVGGWAQAADTLRTATLLAGERPTYLGGTFLAPWLLTPSVVTQAQSSVLPLEFSPQDTGPQQYAAALAATFPGAAPSASGYLAWVVATRSATDDRPRLYGAAPVDVPMMSGPGDMADMGHGAVNPAAWFPGGTVVPVTGPLAGT